MDEPAATAQRPRLEVELHPITDRESGRRCRASAAQLDGDARGDLPRTKVVWQGLVEARPERTRVAARCVRDGSISMARTPGWSRRMRATRPTMLSSAGGATTTTTPQPEGRQHVLCHTRVDPADGSVGDVVREPQRRRIADEQDVDRSGCRSVGTMGRPDAVMDRRCGTRRQRRIAGSLTVCDRGMSACHNDRGSGRTSAPATDVARTFRDGMDDGQGQGQELATPVVTRGHVARQDAPTRARRPGSRTWSAHARGATRPRRASRPSRPSPSSWRRPSRRPRRRTQRATPVGMRRTLPPGLRAHPPSRPRPSRPQGRQGWGRHHGHRAGRAGPRGRPRAVEPVEPDRAEASQGPQAVGPTRGLAHGGARRRDRLSRRPRRRASRSRSPAMRPAMARRIGSATIGRQTAGRPRRSDATVASREVRYWLTASWVAGADRAPLDIRKARAMV